MNFTISLPGFDGKEYRLNGDQEPLMQVLQISDEQWETNKQKENSQVKKKRDKFLSIIREQKREKYF